MSDNYRRFMGQMAGEEEDQNAYRAFPNSRSTPSKLTLRLASGKKRMLPYRFLLEVECDTLANGDWLISLLYPSRSVIIEGQNLDELVNRLEDDAVAWVQEFNPMRWNKILDKDPLIYKITVNVNM
jgi:hypothetical protein